MGRMSKGGARDSFLSLKHLKQKMVRQTNGESNPYYPALSEGPGGFQGTLKS